MKVGTDRWMYGLIDGYIDPSMDVSIHLWMYRSIDGHIDPSTDVSIPRKNGSFDGCILDGYIVSRGMYLFVDICIFISKFGKVFLGVSRFCRGRVSLFDVGIYVRWMYLEVVVKVRS